MDWAYLPRCYTHLEKLRGFFSLPIKKPQYTSILLAVLGLYPISSFTRPCEIREIFFDDDSTNEALNQH
jgi:hypothetical protein